MAKPKLALIPAAQGDKFYSVLPSSGVGDFDFTRSGSATRINSQGLIETVGNGVSRLNYPLIDGKVVGCPSHLLEPSRSNINTYSDPTDAQKGNLSYASVTYQDDFNWGLGNVIKNAIVFGDNSTTRYAYYNSTVVSGTEYTLSVIIKMDDNSVPIPSTDFLFILGGTSAPFVNGYNIEDYDNNTYRISANGVASASNTANGILKVASNSTKGFTISGFQIEQGSYATSYIPTSGSATTRSAETANNSGDASTFNDSEGVLMAEISALANDGTTRELALSDGGVTNRIEIRYISANNDIQGVIRGAASTILLSHNLTDATEFTKVAVKYKSGDYAFWINGFEVQVSTTTGNPTGLNELAFDDGNGDFNMYSNTKQIQYYDSADIDLEKLTSWTSFTDMANGQLYSIK